MGNAQAKKQIVDHYESLSEHPQVLAYYGGTRYLNYGYWDEKTPDQKSACENLMEKLLSFIPEKDGKILDVACGNGATTSYLSKYYPPQNITGINISAGQIERAHSVAPDSTFLLMDATRLDFPDDAFDAIISVEAAFHFNTREKFLKEACRVLKTGGWLVVSDILLTLQAERSRQMLVEENHLKGPQAYEDLLSRSGFGEIQIVDATESCWKAHFMNLVNYVHEKYFTRHIDIEDVFRYLDRPYRRVPDLTYYLLAAARKA